MYFLKLLSVGFRCEHDALELAPLDTGAMASMSLGKEKWPLERWMKVDQSISLAHTLKAKIFAQTDTSKFCLRRFFCYISGPVKVISILALAYCSSDG